MKAFSSYQGTIALGITSGLLWIAPIVFAAEPKPAQLERGKDSAVAAKPTTPISLKKYVNLPLDGDIQETKSAKGQNHLQGLPRGRQVLGGVLFDIDGVVHLHGQPLTRQGKTYPKALTNIPIGGMASQIHLLHATGGRDALGFTVAKLILHFADGTTAEFKINYGEQVADWWSKPEEQLKDPDSTVAWHGENPAAKAAKLEVRLYRTTLRNPHPEREIQTVDLVATGIYAAPFLLGLAVR